MSERIQGILKQTFTRSPYQKMQGPPDGGPGGPEGPGGMPEEKPAFAAIEIKDGKLVAQDKDAVLSGEITDTSAGHVQILSGRGDLGGIYVSRSTYTLEHANIRLSGAGEGLGGKRSGAAVEDCGSLTLRDCRINMDGKLRCATSAGGNSVLKVYDSLLVSHGDPWPATEQEVTWVVGPGMAKPPVYLEIEGNMRTHCTVMDSESYFYNSTVIADSWAALSTDAAGDRVYLEANDCTVITTRSGYGTYADTGCHCRLNRCSLDVANMAAIVAGEASVELCDCTGKCGSYVVLNHVVGGGPASDAILTQVSDIKLIGGRYQCQSPAVIIKSSNADILFDGVSVQSDCGVLLKSRVNDDPCAPDAAGKAVYGIHAVLKNMNTENSIVHEDENRVMSVVLEHTSLTGSITGGVFLTLDAASRWMATEDSHVVLNGDIALEQLDAAAGVTITAKGGKADQVTLPSGGKLVITV